MTYITEKSKKRESGYTSKPKADIRKMSIPLVCIGTGHSGGGCRNVFTAKSPFVRMCGRCTDWVARNG